MIHQIKIFLEWCFYYPFRSFANKLPRRWIVVMGMLTGRLIEWMSPGRAKIAEDEISRLLPELNPGSCIREIVHEAFRMKGLISLENISFPRINPVNIDQWMQLEGHRNLDAVLERGKGAVLVLVHFGSNQLIMAGLGYNGYKVNQIGSTPDEWNKISGIRVTRLEKLIFNARLLLEKSLPAGFIYISASMRPVFDCLKRNEIMLLAADGRAGTRFTGRSVCARTMNMSQGPFRIAYKSGAGILPVFPVFMPEGYHRLILEEEIGAESPLPESLWIEKTATEYAERLSRRLREHPEHYCMLMSEARRRSVIDSVPLFDDYRQADG